MKLAESLILQELVRAEGVVYEDVARNRFWIVCPVCKEAVFKVIRHADSEKQSLHYFSHYEASKAYVTDCELRVGRITERDVEARAIQSRAQKLKYFIASLQDAIHREFRDFIQPDDRIAKTHFHSLTRSHTLAVYRNAQYHHFRKLVHKMTDHEIFLSFDYNIATMRDEERRQLATAFSMETQKRIALDLVKHLTTAQARPTFDCLFDHAFTCLAIRLESNVEHNRVIGCERELLEVLHKLPHTSRRKGLLMLKALQETDHTQLFGKRGDALDTLDQFVLGEMLKILIRLPYLDILRKSLAEQDPLISQTGFLKHN
jgi:hypothetical protein